MPSGQRFGFETEVPFTLPKGYIDATGTLHRQGIMRLATAADEILPLRDPRVQQNSAYLTVIVLARVVTKLGTLADIDTSVIEGLFASDLDYLQGLYESLNGNEEADAKGTGALRPADQRSANGGARGMPRLGEA